MRERSLTLGFLVALCLWPGASESHDVPEWRDTRYRESSQSLPNPERGFYAPRMSHRMGRLNGLRERGITLLLVEVNLKAFKERNLSPEKLAEVGQAFAAARQHGLKVIVRFAYGFTGRDYRSDPKDMGRILGHIGQLGKVLWEDRDVRELELLHATYLNSGYHRGTLDGWRKAEFRGATGFDHIERRLGYRVVADRLRLTKEVKRGGMLRVELELHNAGFAAPHMPRPVALALNHGDRTVRVALTDTDPRRWTPEAGIVTLRGAMSVPADAPGGRWRLALLLADPSPSLSADGRYAIRLANEGMLFDEASGWNILAEDVEIR